MLGDRRSPEPAEPPPDYTNTSIQELMWIMSLDDLYYGQEALDFELKSLSGDTVSLRQFRGNAVIVNFWTTW